jgi:phosphoribosylformylglycinamidine cyclo-ligase
LPGNLPRALPADLDAELVSGSWPVPRIFAEVQAAAGADDAEMARTFNMGLGMVVSVPADQAGQAMEVLADHGLGASAVGKVTRGSGLCRVVAP